MRIGIWLTILPAMGFGVLDVLAPLRLDELGASGLAIGATFFVAAGRGGGHQPGGRADHRPARRSGGRAPRAPGGAVALVVLQLPGAARRWRSPSC